MSNKPKEETSASHKVFTIIGIILCVILIPVLLINIILIIKSYTNAEEVPKIGGYAPLIVLSPSMEPGIKTGDLIFVKQIDPREVKVRDVIAFFDPDGNGSSILTHRVTEVFEENGKLYFRTQGDANTAGDRLPVSGNKLVGIYTDFRIPGAGSVAMFMQTTAGLIVCVVVPLVLLVGWDIIRRRRYEQRNRQDTDALLAELESLKAAQNAQSAANAAQQTELKSEDESNPQ